MTLTRVCGDRYAVTTPGLRRALLLKQWNADDNVNMSHALEETTGNPDLLPLGAVSVIALPFNIAVLTAW